MHNKKNKYPRFIHPLALAIVCASAGTAHAVSFQTDSGWKGQWNTTLSIGSQWSAQGQDSALYSAAKGALRGKSGGTGGSFESGNLN